jgi:hypothetical protein
MMTANSLNMLLTISPLNQRNNLGSKSPLRGATMRSRDRLADNDDTGNDVDEDVVCDYVSRLPGQSDLPDRRDARPRNSNVRDNEWGEQVWRI